MSLTLHLTCSRSLKVKCDDAIRLHICGFLLMFNSTVYNRMQNIGSFTGYKALKCLSPTIWPFKVIQGQIKWCNWTPPIRFVISVYSNHMSISHRLVVISARKSCSYPLSLSQNFGPPPPPSIFIPGELFSKSNNFIYGSEGRLSPKWSWLAKYFLG